MYLDQIADAMQKQKISKTRLSQMAGMNYDNLRNRLTGTADFRVSELVYICRLLNIRMNDLDFGE